MKTSKNNDKEKNTWLKKIKGCFQKRKKQPNFVLSVFITTLRILLISFIILGFAGFGAFVGIAKGYLDATPVLDLERIENQSETSFIYDRHGNLITPYYGLENRVWATLDEIPKRLQDAVLAVEDVRFYVHKGIDLKRLLGAVINNLKNESVQGASTITQQLIKNTLLTPERSYKRKIQEAYLAIQLEQNYSKEQILEAYLNTSYFGSGNYGVKTAAKDYFGKELKDLTIRECAILAGILKNPYYYDPRKNFYDQNRNPEITYNRTNLVLRLMYENGFITKEEYEEAKFSSDKDPFEDGFTVIEKSSRESLYPMPYFVEYVILDVRDRLMEQNGWTGDEGRQKAMKLIQEGGLHIYTTVDPEIQKSLEQTVYNYKNLPKLANSNDRVLKDNQGNEIEQPQAAAVVMDHNTGEIIAMVGGRSSPKGQFWTNRANLNWSPGSSIKPLSVYGPFIEAGYPGGIILEDVPAPVKGWKGGSKEYPNNYDYKFSGLVDVRTAIRRSINVAAARIVAERVSTDYAAEKLLEMGISTSAYVKDKFPSSLSLGSDAINMIETTAAYATIANKGIYQRPISFTKVIDKNGNEILSKDTIQVKRVVFKESTTFILTDLMEEVVKSGTGRSARLSKAMPVAAKTGTVNDFKGIYFAGFTPYYTATVWIGHDLWKPLAKGTQSARYAAPLWKAIMDPIHQDLENKPFYDKVPDSVVRVTVCSKSGKLPNGDLCENDISGHGVITEWFPKEAVPKEKCDMHKEVKICKFSGKLASPYCPEEHIAKKSVIVIPENSVLRKLSDAELEKYVPGAFKTSSDLEGLNYENPEDREYFCHLHTSEWQESESKRESLLQQVQDLINKVKNNMNNPEYREHLTNDMRNRLEKAIEDLLKSIEKIELKPPGDNDEPIKELPKFDSKKVEENMSKLSELNDNIFDAIRRKIEEENNQPPPHEHDNNDRNNNKKNNNNNNFED